MYQDTYYVPKRSGTYSDVLVAYGLAALLDHLLGLGGVSKRKVLIEDGGSDYVIRLSEPIRKEWIEKAEYFAPPSPYIVRGGGAAPDGLHVKDMKEKRSRVSTYWEQWHALRDDKVKVSEIRNQLADLEPSDEWEVISFVGDGRMQAIGIYNRIVSQWPKTRGFFGDTLRTILASYSGDELLRDEWLSRWMKEAKKHGIRIKETASQLLNPHQGKGQNETKSNALRMDNIKDRIWMEEILKVIGMWHSVAPRRIEGGKDWKAYVISPLRLSLASNGRAFKDFRKVIWREGRSTALKSDITSLLLFVSTWLDYVEAVGVDELAAEMGVMSVAPENVVAGFYVAQFKKLSQQAYTMVNLSFLQTPAWSGDLKSKEDVNELKGVIKEHLNVVRAIDEGRSDGFDLLRRYRNFVAGNRWEAFFDFLHGYSQEIMKRLGDGDRWVPTFTTKNLGRLIMASRKDLLPIVQSAGFQNIACAIRYSTVIPQGRKARHDDNLYEVRYGLGAELKRKAAVKDEFIAALMDFVQSYSRENSQVLESKGKQMRCNVRTGDIEDIVRLVDEYGSEVVANLLVAYGYAWDSHEGSNGSDGDS